MILLDTNVVSAFMRLDEEPLIVRWLSTLEAADLHVPALVVLEVQFGIECLPSGRKRRHLEMQRDFVLSQMLKDRTVHFHHGAALATAAIYAMPANRKQDTKIIDFQIAGMGKALKAAIATRNAKDFKGLGVKIIDPWSGQA
jgi:toxin FitB